MAKKPSRIQFSIKTKCQFNCHFCVYQPDPYQYWNFDTQDFLSFSKKFYDFGVREFELTPVIGESLHDPMLFTKLRHLTSLGAEKIIVFTNAHGLDQTTLDYLDEFPALELNISIYGGTIKEFKERTGVDGYTVVCSAVGQAIGTLKNRVVIHKRYSGRTQKRMKMWFDVAKEMGIPIWDCSLDTDWHEMTRSGLHALPHMRGVCRFALEDNAVLPNGDITMCGWFDVNGKMVIGNINDQELSEIYGEESKFAQIVEDQKKGIYKDLCRTCSMKYDERNKHSDN
jgi:radical SAM protein with 4Fe4S-binding SPASM domain